MIEYKDLAGTKIYISEENINLLIRALTPEKQRFSKLIANTIKQPDEIWQTWESVKNIKGQWQKVRSYLQYIDLSNTDVQASYGVSIVRFVFNIRWELNTIEMEIGEEKEISQKINTGIRIGEIVYSKIKH